MRFFGFGFRPHFKKNYIYRHWAPEIDLTGTTGKVKLQHAEMKRIFMDFKSIYNHILLQN